MKALPLDWAWIAGYLIVSFVGGVFVAFLGLFGWMLAKTHKNSKDLNVLHSQKREHERRISRIETFINGRVCNEQKPSAIQNLLGGSSDGDSSFDSPDPDLDFE